MPSATNPTVYSCKNVPLPVGRGGIHETTNNSTRRIPGTCGITPRSSRWKAVAVSTMPHRIIGVSYAGTYRFNTVVQVSVLAHIKPSSDGPPFRVSRHTFTRKGRTASAGSHPEKRVDIDVVRQLERVRRGRRQPAEAQDHQRISRATAPAHDQE